MVFRLETKYSYPFIVIFYHYNWYGRLIKFSDIDECARNSHLCSNITVTCKKKNTRRSFRCICKPEFSGDGHNCTGTEQISEHDALSRERERHKTGQNRVNVYGNSISVRA